MSKRNTECDCCLTNAFRSNPFKAGLCGDCQHAEVDHGISVSTETHLSARKVYQHVSTTGRLLQSSTPVDTKIAAFKPQNDTPFSMSLHGPFIGIKLGNYNTMAALYKPKTSGQRSDDVEMITLNYGENSLSTTVSFDSTGALLVNLYLLTIQSTLSFTDSLVY
ncbi:hypothetical protein GEMRC1_008107 [Eukaryota sp. GEM-RC1]